MYDYLKPYSAPKPHNEETGFPHVHTQNFTGYNYANSHFESATHAFNTIKELGCQGGAFTHGWPIKDPITGKPGLAWKAQFSRLRDYAAFSFRMFGEQPGSFNYNWTFSNMSEERQERLVRTACSMLEEAGIGFQTSAIKSGTAFHFQSGLAKNLFAVAIDNEMVERRADGDVKEKIPSIHRILPSAPSGRVRLRL
jgi:hypothetical protein